METLTIVVQFMCAVILIVGAALFVDDWMHKRVQRQASDEQVRRVYGQGKPYDHERDGL